MSRSHRVKPTDSDLIKSSTRAFSRLGSSAKSRSARLHKYWSRKPEEVVSQLIERYSGESETVLDSFCGSGVVGIEAIRLGRSFVGVDLNPMAVRVSRDALSRTFDVRQFDESFQFLHSAVSEKVNALFALKGDLLLYSLPNARDGANAVTRG